MHIRTFLAVVEAGNYTAAADQLHMSQPAVSLHIRSLEDQLGGVRLFRRMGQRMVPTHAGEELLAAAKELVALSERTEQTIRSLRGHVTGRVAIGCTPGGGETLLPSLLAVFLAQCPEVVLDVVVEPAPLLLDALEMRRVSLLLFEEQQRRRGWETHALGNEPLVLLAPPEHPLIQQADVTVTMGMLREYPLVLPRTGLPMRRTIEQGIRQRGGNAATLNITLETDSTTLMLACVQSGLGLAFVPATCIPATCRLERLHLAGDNIQQEWHIVRLRERGMLRAAQELYAFLTGAAAADLLHQHGITRKD